MTTHAASRPQHPPSLIWAVSFAIWCAWSGSLGGCGISDSGPNLRRPQTSSDAQGSADFSGSPPYCRPAERSTRSYSYDDAGSLQEIRYQSASGSTDITTFAQGRVSRRVIGKDPSAWSAEAYWRYEDNLLVGVDGVNRDPGSPPKAWSLTLTYGEAGLVTEAKVQGTLSKHFADDTSLKTVRLILSQSDREDAEMISGVNLYWPPDAPFIISLFNGSPVDLIIRYAYDDAGRVTRAEWDTNADGIADIIREDQRSDLTHVTRAFLLTDLLSPYITVERHFNASGQPEEVRVLDLNGALTTHERWSWRDPLPDNPCGATRELYYTGDWHAADILDEELIRRYDSEGRLMFEAYLGADGTPLDLTFITHLPDGRLEEIDDNADGIFDRTVRDTYDQDGRIVSSLYLVNTTTDANCDPMRAWHSSATCADTSPHP